MLVLAQLMPLVTLVIGFAKLSAIEFTTQLEECDGHEGIYTYREHTILFCRVSDQDWVALPRLMMHELGHAWDDLNMTDARRYTYMSQSDLEAPRPGLTGTSLTMSVQVRGWRTQWRDWSRGSSIESGSTP